MKRRNIPVRVYAHVVVYQSKLVENALEGYASKLWLDCLQKLYAHHLAAIVDINETLTAYPY